MRITEKLFHIGLLFQYCVAGKGVPDRLAPSGWVQGDLESYGIKVHVGRQFAKGQVGKLFLIVSAPRKETSVYRAAIYRQIIIKCQVEFLQ